MSFRTISLADISLVTLSSTVYIEDISAIRWNDVDISNSLPNEFPQGNPEFIALSNLREYKNREGLRIYDDPFARIREGRATGNNIDFSVYDYETRKMRRKADVLQYKENSFTKRNVRSNKLSQYQLKLIRDRTNLTNCEKKGGLCNSIVYDTNVPFENNL